MGVNTSPGKFASGSGIFCKANITWNTGEWLRSEEHTSELQSRLHLVCRLLLEKKNTLYTTSSVVIEASFALPATTRLLRDDFLSRFETMDKSGSIPDYYTHWDIRGSVTVLPDG